MNYRMTKAVRAPLARISRRVAAIVAECNYAQELISAPNTPARF